MKEIVINKVTTIDINDALDNLNRHEVFILIENFKNKEIVLPTLFGYYLVSFSKLVPDKISKKELINYISNSEKSLFFENKNEFLDYLKN